MMDFDDVCGKSPGDECAEAADGFRLAYTCAGADYTKCTKPGEDIVYDITTDLLTVCAPEALLS